MVFLFSPSCLVARVRFLHGNFRGMAAIFGQRDKENKLRDRLFCLRRVDPYSLIAMNLNYVFSLSMEFECRSCFYINEKVLVQFGFSF